MTQYEKIEQRLRTSISSAPEAQPVAEKFASLFKCVRAFSPPLGLFTLESLRTLSTEELYAHIEKRFGYNRTQIFLEGAYKGKTEQREKSLTWSEKRLLWVVAGTLEGHKSSAMLDILNDERDEDKIVNSDSHVNNVRHYLSSEVVQDMHRVKHILFRNQLLAPVNKDRERELQALEAHFAKSRFELFKVAKEYEVLRVPANTIVSTGIRGLSADGIIRLLYAIYCKKYTLEELHNLAQAYSGTSVKNRILKNFVRSVLSDVETPKYKGKPWATEDTIKVATTLRTAPHESLESIGVFFGRTRNSVTGLIHREGARFIKNHPEFAHLSNTAAFILGWSGLPFTPEGAQYAVIAARSFAEDAQKKKTGGKKSRKGKAKKAT